MINKYILIYKRKYKHYNKIKIIKIRFSMINIIIILTIKTTALAVLF